MKILISGHKGFIGKHLIRALKIIKHDYNVEFLIKSDFESDFNLENKIAKNDIIYHFAGVNRDINEKIVYEKNDLINNTLLNALDKIHFQGKLFFTSSTQENKNTIYGKAKKNARLKFLDQSNKLGYKFYGLILPNVFGPFCKPNYNSFIATFCSQIILNKTPEIITDDVISLIYVSDLVDKLLKSIYSDLPISFEDITYKKNVSEVLSQLKRFDKEYIQQGNYPNIESHFDLCLFNTFKSYIDNSTFFPRKYNVYSDSRGLFLELIRSGSKGQSSISITKKNEIRGNHFHTRKCERFSVISGKAKIQIREILSDEIIEFFLDGDNISYVDIPIWFTHNITNIGDEDLITAFWINEHYEEIKSDTYIEIV